MVTNGSATKIIPKVKLPTLSVDGRTTPDAWPLPVIPLGVELSAQVANMMRVAPPTDQDRIEASKRQMDFYAEQEAGRIRLGEEAEARAREQRRAAAGG
jgi:hypothetical protein